MIDPMSCDSEELVHIVMAEWLDGEIRTECADRLLLAIEGRRTSRRVEFARLLAERDAKAAWLSKHSEKRTAR